MSLSGNKCSKEISAPQNPTSFMLAGQDYVLVPKKDGSAQKAESKQSSGGSESDVKDSIAPTAALTSSKLLTRGLRVRKLGRNSVMSARIVTHTNFTTTANTVYSTVVNLVPGNANAFNSFGTLFDECRCVGVRALSKTALVAGSVAAGGFDAHCVTAIDPGTSTVLANLADGLEYDHHSEPFTITCFGGLAPVDAEKWIPVPSADVSTLQVKYWKPIPTIESGITADLVGGGWFPCTSSSSAIVGYLKPYIEAAGTGTQFRWMLIIEYLMEFRTRG